MGLSNPTAKQMNLVPFDKHRHHFFHLLLQFQLLVKHQRDRFAKKDIMNSIDMDYKYYY